MTTWKIYHNPKCSQSREALSLLKAQKIEPEIIDYLKDPLDEAHLRALIKALGEPVSTLVRTKEEDYKKLKFDINSQDEVVKYLAKYPRLLQRPIVFKGKKGLIPRPMEKLEELLKSSRK